MQIGAPTHAPGCNMRAWALPAQHALLKVCQCQTRSGRKPVCKCRCRKCLERGRCPRPALRSCRQRVPAMAARDAMLDRRIFMLHPLCYRTTEAIRREANTTFVRGGRFMHAAEIALQQNASARRSRSQHQPRRKRHLIAMTQSPWRLALTFCTDRRGSNRASVLRRAIVRVGRPGMVQGIHSALRP